MTAQELKAHFNRVYGVNTTWPKTYEVDPVTYANCCQAVFDHKVNTDEYIMECMNLNTHITSFYQLDIHVGPNKGLMFKNVELILKP